MNCSSLRIIVAGLIAQYPLGGMTWHYLQFVLGLRRLGHDVYYLEDTGAAPYDPARGGVFADCEPAVQYLAHVMRRFGLTERWAYRSGPRDRWFGLTDKVRKEITESADLLVNVSGMLERPEEYRKVGVLAYVDTDPVFNQIKLAQGDERFCELVDAHDVHFSFGERLGTAAVPVSGHDWQPTRQPIVLDQWHPEAAHREVFTTVMNWTASKHPPLYEGRIYGQKDVEFERFIDLPRRAPGAVLEIAINPGKRWQAPLDRLKANGWRVVNPEKVCLDWESYRTYIESSKAEWSVAKNGYVQGRPGWFSDRSACYLAAGRPVVVQDTGLSSIPPVAEGVLVFHTPQQAVDAIAQIQGDYARHARCARAIAEAYFDSNKVLSSLIDRCTSTATKTFQASGDV